MGLIPVAEAAIIVVVSAVLVVYFWRVFRASPGQMLLLGLTMINDERGRGLHDRLAGSVVVRRDGSPS